MTPSPNSDELQTSVGVSRPPKRTQATSETSFEAGVTTSPIDQEHPTIDRIFITDGIGKKPAAKKPPLSCAECRRLKLKCDRVFPCKSCRKRGCQDICPAGVLVSGKGTRFILANTEQLHLKINEMSERIRQLEETVQSLQSQLSSDPHPLLIPSLLEIKSTLVLYGETQTGTLQDSSSYPTAQAGDLIQVQDSDRFDASQDQFMSNVTQLSRQFPFGVAVSPEPDPSLRDRIRQMLPPRETARYLWQQACQNALWQYNPHPNDTFMENLTQHVYDSSVEVLCPRRLALLFMILAIGCLVDLNQPPDSPDAENYHCLARASLSEIPVMEDTTVDAILVLFYMIWYLSVFSDKKKAVGYAWGIMGLTANLSQSIGLHRENANSKITSEDVERRRTLFWELMYLDARLSITLGRPPSLCNNFTDCNTPSYFPDKGVDTLASPHHYHQWKHSTYVNLLSPLLDVISSPTLVYDDIIDLDKRLRNFPRPPVFVIQTVSSRPLTMQRASSSTALEAALLQLHRTFFVRVLSCSVETCDVRHRHAPSVVAVFLSASRTIATVEALYLQEPELSSRILCFWSNTFSAAVSLCLLVSRAPFNCLSPVALLELERAKSLFNSAKGRCSRATQFVSILETMVDRANHAYERWSQGREVPALLRPAYETSDGSEFLTGSSLRPSRDLGKLVEQGQCPEDPFAKSHPSLFQAIVEAHQRAAALFPMRKPCHCSRVGPCLPSHSWNSSSVTSHSSPVLPDLYLSQYACPSSLRAAVSPQTASVPPPPNSRSVVEDVDSEPSNPNWNDQNWMAWF